MIFYRGFPGEVPDVSRGAGLLTLVQRYVERMLTVFGLPGPSDRPGTDGMPSAEIVQALSTFRDEARSPRAGNALRRGIASRC